MITYEKNKYQQSGRGSGPRDLQNRRNRPVADSQVTESAIVATLHSQIALLTEQLKHSGKTINGITPEELDMEVRKAVAQTKRELESRYEDKEREFKKQLEQAIMKAAAAPSDDEVNAVIEKATQEAKAFHEAKAQRAIDHANEKIAEAERRFKVQSMEITLKNKNLETRLADKEKDIIRLEAAVKEAQQTAKHNAELIKIKDDIIVSLRGDLADIKDMPAKTNTERPQMEQAFIDPTEKSNKKVESHIKVEETTSITKKEEMTSSVNKLKSLMGTLPKK